MEIIKPYLPSGMSIHGMIFYSIIIYIFSTIMTNLIAPLITKVMDIDGNIK